MAAAFDLAHTVFYAKGGFGFTPHDGALTMAGTVKFTDLQARPNWNRGDILVKRARRVLPGLKIEQAVRAAWVDARLPPIRAR